MTTFLSLGKDKTPIPRILKRTLQRIHSAVASQEFSVQYLHALTPPSAINYASVFSNQPTATYSAISIGASPTDAILASVTEVSPGTGAAGSPPDPNEQGISWNVDHILELQFVVGAFQVNPRPYAHIFSRDLRASSHGERSLADTNHKKYHRHYIDPSRKLELGITRMLHLNQRYLCAVSSLSQNPILSTQLKPSPRPKTTIRRLRLQRHIQPPRHP